MAAEHDPRVLIGTLVQVRQQLAEADADQLFEYDYPQVRAEPEAVARAESWLGERLPDSYRDFLLAANGWPHFFQDISLFGADELLGAHALAAEVEERLDFFQPVLRSLHLTPDDVLAIGASAFGSDVLAIVRSGRVRAEQVLWLPGDPIEIFESFEDAMLSFIEYARRDLETFVRGGGRLE